MLVGSTRQAAAVPEISRPARRSWREGYVVSVAVADVSASVLGASVAGWLAPLAAAEKLVLFLAFPLAWLLAQLLSRSYDGGSLGEGSTEYSRVARGGVGLVATLATLDYFAVHSLPPGALALASVVATSTGLVLRYALRQRLHRRRVEGECLQRVVVVGHPDAVEQMVAQLDAERYHGYRVVGAVLPQGGQRPYLLDAGVPVVGGFDRVLEAVRLVDADTVAVLTGPELSGPALRRIAWSLESTQCELLVSPGLVEVAGPRLSIRPVAGLPLLHVERPEFSGVGRLVKALIDRGGAAAALLLLGPLFLAIAAAVRLTSDGSVFFRQTRIGRAGKPFTMLKFRSMVVNAEEQLAALQSRSDGNGVLFKLKVDPRVTRVGAILRRYSVDELPQLVNVLRGEMSLVGPRPPLPEEVDAYHNDVRRRLLVKPGLTGLWQVSGRSDLSWEDSVRLDLRYVDNWSVGLDVAILWKTTRAVIAGSGAY